MLQWLQEPRDIPCFTVNIHYTSNQCMTLRFLAATSAIFIPLDQYGGNCAIAPWAITNLHFQRWCNQCAWPRSCMQIKNTALPYSFQLTTIIMWSVPTWRCLCLAELGCYLCINAIMIHDRKIRSADFWYIMLWHHHHCHLLLILQ